MLAQRHKRMPSITSALGQCIVLSWFSGDGQKASPAYSNVSVPANTGKSPNAVLMWASFEYCGSTLKQHRVNAMCLLMLWRKVYSRPSVRLALGQPRRRLTGIKSVMGCDACPTMNEILSIQIFCLLHSNRLKPGLGVLELLF